jgi:hypothetical protein
LNPKHLLYILIIFSSENGFAQLNGKIRSNFVDSYLQSCFNSQRSASVNKAADDKTIYQYCKCNGLYIAELMNNDLLASIEKGEQKMNSNVIQMAASFCSKNFKKY